MYGASNDSGDGPGGERGVGVDGDGGDKEGGHEECNVDYGGNGELYAGNSAADEVWGWGAGAAEGG